MTVRDARADELSVELLAPCEGSSVSRDHRVTIRAPFGRIGVQSLPIIHPFIALPVEVWGPPGTRAHVRLRFERPGEDVDLDVGPPIEITFDGSGICGIAASLERLWLRSEGVHAIAVLAGDRVLARRRITVCRIPEWDWPKNEVPGAL